MHLLTLDDMSWSPLWDEYLQKGRPRVTKLDTTQNNASARLNSAGLEVSYKFESGWLASWSADQI